MTKKQILFNVLVIIGSFVIIYFCFFCLDFIFCELKDFRALYEDLVGDILARFIGFSFVIWILYNSLRSFLVSAWELLEHFGFVKSSCAEEAPNE